MKKYTIQVITMYKISFLLLSFFSNFKIYYFKNKDYYIVDHLKNFLKNYQSNIKRKMIYQLILI